MEEEITLKEYWSHVGELLKYFFKYFGIAIAQTFKAFGRGIIKLLVKAGLLQRLDEDGNVIEEEDIDEEKLDESIEAESADPEDNTEVLNNEDESAAENQASDTTEETPKCKKMSIFQAIKYVFSSDDDDKEEDDDDYVFEDKDDLLHHGLDDMYDEVLEEGMDAEANTASVKVNETSDYTLEPMIKVTDIKVNDLAAAT